jgi:hypothetical protein
MALCLISDAQFCWEHLVDWGFMHLNGKGLRANLCKLTSGLLFTIFGFKEMLYFMLGRLRLRIKVSI